MTNRLADSPSLYLRKHAENPIDWWPWCDEALAQASQTDKPIFLSIGYSSCHWCTVMEGEAFSDLAIAAYMNANFIPIKVDREERPDIDSIYMQALHRAAETAVNARSEVREAYGNYRSAYDIARHHRDEIVPLRKTMADENVLRYNAMLIGVFELLADTRDNITSVMGAIQAQQQFWLADAGLSAALLGKPLTSGVPTLARSGSGSTAAAGGH